jgi:hypothetical protein
MKTIFNVVMPDIVTRTSKSVWFEKTISTFTDNYKINETITRYPQFSIQIFENNNK